MPKIQDTVCDVVFIIILLVTSYVLITTTLKTDIWYPDEGIYSMWSQGLIDNKGIPNFFVNEFRSELCPGHAFFKPPVTIYAMTLFKIIGGETGFKLFAPVFSILMLVLCYYIIAKLTNKALALVGCLFIYGVPIMIKFSVISYMEIFSALVLLVTTYLLYIALMNPKNKKAMILAGIFVGIGMLSRESMILLVPALILYAIITYVTEKRTIPAEINVIKNILLIGLLVSSPYFLKNYIVLGNPVYPQGSDLFGWNYLDEKGYDVVVAGQNVSINFPTMYKNYGLFIYFAGIAIVLSIRQMYHAKQINKLYLLILCIVSVFFVGFFMPSQAPFALTARDYRHLIPTIPILCILLCGVITTYNKYSYLACVITLLLFASMTYVNITENSNNALLEDKMPQNMQKYYEWVNQHTEEDAIIMDVISGITAYHTNRRVMFPSQFCGYELWKFWELEEEDAKILFEKHGIDYITFHRGLMSDANNVAWGIMPSTALIKMDGYSFSEIAFQTDNTIVFMIYT